MDRESLTLGEMLARRDATEREVAAAIGKLVFIYSRFVTGLHLCVAWLEDGKHLKDYPEVAESLVVAELLKRIEKRASAKFGRQSSGFRAYKNWLRRAHQLREVRNIAVSLHVCARMVLRWFRGRSRRHAWKSSDCIWRRNAFGTLRSRAVREQEVRLQPHADY